MSPEQAKGEVCKVDARSDLYSLGVIFYELLTGELPFRGQTRMLLVQVMQDEPRPPWRLNDKIPKDLETICLKALAKEPGRRYATAQALADDLRRWLKGEPILARPVGPGERLWRWSKRNPMVASLMAAVSGLLVLVAGVASVGYVQSSMAWRQEAKQRAAAEDAAAKAREAADKVRRLQYAANMHLAAQVWESEGGSATTVRDLLLEHMPKDGQEDLRDFPWRYQWNRLRNGAPTFRGHLGAVAVAFAPDGHLMTLDGDHALRHWDSTNARLLATANDTTVKIYNASTGESVSSLQGHGDAVANIAFSPDDKYLATASVDGGVKIWGVNTGQQMPVQLGW